MPIANYKIWEMVHLESSNSLVSPYLGGTSGILGVSIENQESFPAFVSDRKRLTPAPYTQFNMTIGRLGIREAKVVVDNNDLDKGPSLLPGTALPGEKGNIFISSHSSVLFNNNFSRLMNLKVGDKVELKAGETIFSYQVMGIKVVDPGDLSVIDPPNSTGRFLSLMTCVPPGLNFKRLVVLAELI